MAFFRIKKIKGIEYGYIVENEWKGNASRQRVKGYLGKIYRFKLINDRDFLDFLGLLELDKYVQENDPKKIITDLIDWELWRFGINKLDFLIDYKNLIIQKSGRKVTLAVNGGFLCDCTLKNLLDFKPVGDQKTVAYRLARAFVESGIKVPYDIFASIFQKLLSLPLGSPVRTQRVWAILFIVRCLFCSVKNVISADKKQGCANRIACFCNVFGTFNIN